MEREEREEEEKRREGKMRQAQGAGGREREREGGGGERGDSGRDWRPTLPYRQLTGRAWPQRRRAAGGRPGRDA